jgi:hypothetical protein
MKIALCLQGQPRIWRQGYEHLNREILSKYDVDIFGHTWWSEDMIGEYYDCAPWSPRNYQVEPNLIEDISLVYKFKKFKYEKSKKFIPQRRYNIVDIERHDLVYDSLLSRYYSLNKVLNILENYEKENNIDYDWLIITRYDIGIFHTFPNLNTPEENVDKIFTSDYHGIRKFIFNDNLWLIGKNHKYIFKTLFDDFDKIYDIQQNLHSPEYAKYAEQLVGSELLDYRNVSGEAVMAYHLLFNDVLSKTIQLHELNYNLIR